MGTPTKSGYSHNFGVLPDCGATPTVPCGQCTRTHSKYSTIGLTPRLWPPLCAEGSGTIGSSKQNQQEQFYAKQTASRMEKEPSFAMPVIAGRIALKTKTDTPGKVRRCAPERMHNHGTVDDTNITGQSYIKSGPAPQNEVCHPHVLQTWLWRSVGIDRMHTQTTSEGRVQAHVEHCVCDGANRFCECTH